MSDLFGDSGVTPTEEMIERALRWMMDNTGALAVAIAQRQHTEQWIKVVEAREKAKRKEEAAHVQEREARASDEYAAALTAFRDASGEEQRMRYTWQLAQTVIECWRTKAANERRV